MLIKNLNEILSIITIYYILHTTYNTAIVKFSYPYSSDSGYVGTIVFFWANLTLFNHADRAFSIEKDELELVSADGWAGDDDPFVEVAVADSDAEEVRVLTFHRSGYRLTEVEMLYYRKGEARCGSGEARCGSGESGLEMSGCH